MPTVKYYDVVKYHLYWIAPDSTNGNSFQGMLLKQVSLSLQKLRMKSEAMWTMTFSVLRRLNSWKKTELMSGDTGKVSATGLTLKKWVLVAQSCLILCDPMDLACQAPLSMGFSRQEYRKGLSFLSPRDISELGLNPGLLHCRQILYYWASRKTLI